MIEIKADLKGLPFFLIINNKEVVYERRNKEGELIEKVQWFPPQDKKVLINLPPEEYAQWSACHSEDEVVRMIKFDLIKNGCKIEERIIDKSEKRFIQAEQTESIKRTEDIKEKEVINLTDITVPGQKAELNKEIEEIKKYD